MAKFGRSKEKRSDAKLIVLDAGIATEENLKLIQEKGYDYVCISRSKIKDYSIKDGEVLHRIKTQNKQEISL